MNNFSKEELQQMGVCLMILNNDIGLNYSGLHKKIQSMIDNYCEEEEKEVYSCSTGMAVSDNFFHKQQHLTSEDLIPAIHELVNQCDGMIKTSGLYAFKLKVVKLK